MSDRAADPPGPTTEDEAMARLSQVLNGKKAKGDCAICNANSWQLLDRVREPTMLPVMAAHLPTPGYVTYTLACENCGFIRQHLASVIDQAAQEHPAKGSNA